MKRIGGIIMLEKLIKNIAKNFIYVVWVILYFSLAWSILGADWDSFVLVFFLYGISILIALSPIGEVLLRFIEKVRPISTREEKEYLIPLFEEVYENAKEKDIKLNNNIKLYIIDNMYVNAFAIGRKTIAVTVGAIQTFSQDELKGVIAHEFGHISNGDTKALLLSTIGNGIFTILIFILRIIMLITEVVFSLTRIPFLDVFALLARFIFDIGIIIFSYVSEIILSVNSRQNELWADRFAFDIGFGEELVSSLYILQKISLPQNIKLIDRLRASHPNTAKRIEQLENLLDTQDEKVFITG